MSRPNGKAAALAMIDIVAARGLALAAPIRFGVAESPEGREATYRLRYEVSIKQGYARSEDLAAGVEYDSYDDRALHVAGWDGDKLATTARLVFPEPGSSLPTEAAFDLEIEPCGQVVDMGRVIVAHEFSEARHRILAGLFAYCWTLVRARGFVCVCAAFATSASVRLYRNMGFQITPLAQPRHYWGEERYPVRFDVLDSAPTLSKRWAAEDESTSDRRAQTA